MRSYRKGNVLRLTHISGEQIQGAFGFVDENRLGLYVYFKNITPNTLNDPFIEIFSGGDKRYHDKDILLLKIPYCRLREMIKKVDSSVMQVL